MHDDEGRLTEIRLQVCGCTSFDTDVSAFLSHRAFHQQHHGHERKHHYG
jgi:hypothetical protein